MLSTGITQEQQDIIYQTGTETQKLKLISFAKYLNLPWDNLVEFTKVVKANEKTFQEQIRKKNSVATTEDYLQNVFHIFNHPISESPLFLQKKLNLRSLSNLSYQLLLQKGWNDLKDSNGENLDSGYMLIFLIVLTSRLLNLNSCIRLKVPKGNVGFKTSNRKYLKLLPGLNEMRFTPLPEKKATYLDKRFTIYFDFLAPQNIAKVSSMTMAFEEDDRNLTRESEIESYFLMDRANFLTSAFKKSLFPNLINANAINIVIDTQPSVKDWISLKQSIYLKENPDEILDQGLTDVNGIIDIAMTLKGVGVAQKIPHKASQKLILLELKNEADIVRLARQFFEQFKSTESGLRASGATGYKRRKITGEKRTTTDTENDRFYSYLLQGTSYCKINGTPIVVISNGFDLIVLKARNFYSKISKELDKSDPRKVKLFDSWDVTIIKESDRKYSSIMVWCCLIMDESKGFLGHQALSNAQITNWHLTYGASPTKQKLDVVRYLVSRKTFEILMRKKIGKTDRSKINFKWMIDPSLNLLITQSNLDGIISRAVAKIKKSNKWKNFTGYKSLGKPLRILDSTDFEVLRILQNETWCSVVGGTTMRCIFKSKTVAVLKIFDINRMPTSSDINIEFLDGNSVQADFETILGVSFKFWLNEVNVYNLLRRMDCIPKLLDLGYLYISDLQPGVSIDKLTLYENYLIQSKRKLKTDAFFLFIEEVEMVAIEDMGDIDFDDLKKRALKDLNTIHRAGVIHLDIAPRNIIIRRSDALDGARYKVIFIDFGQSIIISDSKAKKSETSILDIDELKRLDEENLEKAIDYFRVLALPFKKTNDTASGGQNN